MEGIFAGPYTEGRSLSLSFLFVLAVDNIINGNENVFALEKK
jgi:hypothetical protein